jgi:hypothetical protein
MPDTYKNSQSEDNDEARAWRLKIKKQKKNLVPFGRPLGPKAKWGDGVGPVRRGLKNPLLLLKKREAEEKEKERKRNEKYKKEAKRQDRMS